MRSALNIAVAGFMEVYDVSEVGRALQELPASASETLKSTYECCRRCGSAPRRRGLLAAEFDSSGCLTNRRNRGLPAPGEEKIAGDQNGGSERVTS